MATGLTGPSASPLAGRSSPADPNAWLHGPLSNTFFADPAFDDPLTLTAEEQRIFDALGDDAGFAESLLSEHPDDKEVILAAAQAAGLHKGSMRRTAFSMNDLQALQPPGPPSPDDSGRDIPSASSMHLKLESVPEHHAVSGYQQATPMDASSSAELNLGRSSLEQHRMDAMNVEPSSAAMNGPFDMPGSLFTGGTPTEDALPPTHLGVSQNSAHAKGTAPMGAVPDLFGFYNAQSPATSGTGDNAASPMAKAASTEEVKMLQGFADTLLQQQQANRQQQHQQHNQQQQKQQQQVQQQQQKAKQMQAAQAATTQPQRLAPHQQAAQAAQALQRGAGAANLKPPTVPTSGPAVSQQQQQQQQQGPATLTSDCFPPRASQMPKSMRMSEERERSIRRSQSAIELRSLHASGSLPRQDSDADLSSYDHVGIELTTPEGHTYHVGRLSNEDRAQKILRYRQKRHERNFSKRIKYQCRKTLADSRPRVRGRFARNNDVGAVMPHETKKAQAERAKRRAAGQQAEAAQPRVKQEELFPGALDGDLDGYGSFGTDDLLPTSALPMGDLPPLPELSSLMSSPGSSAVPMPGLSESDTPTLNFPSSTMGSSAFDSLPATGGMLGGHFEGLGGPQEGRRYNSGSSSGGPFSFGSDFIPDELLNSRASRANKRA